MRTCLKCQGALRYDWEFPAMVCQRCGKAYYFNPFPEALPATAGKAPLKRKQETKAAT